MFSFQSMKQDGEKLLSLFSADLDGIRAGRAKPSLVENVLVEAYGSMMRMMEVASISASDSQTIVIKPWDPTILSAIEKAIKISDLHINPVVDSDIVRLSIPPLTGERRQELVKLVLQKQHSYEDMLRDIRTKYKKQIDGQKGQPGISEDTIKLDLEEMQKVTEGFTKRIEEVASSKKLELETV